MEHMTPDLLFQRLSEISQDEDSFPYRLDDLVKELPNTDDGLILVPIIFRFLEDHPDLDYGSPGALVHYVEKFWKRGYEKYLVESVSRHPISHTIGMLNSLVNGTKDAASKMQLVELMRSTARHPLADSATQERATHYLKFQGYSV